MGEKMRITKKLKHRMFVYDDGNLKFPFIIRNRFGYKTDELTPRETKGLYNMLDQIFGGAEDKSNSYTNW